MDAAFIIVPGYGNSGPAHWQSIWERTLSARRIHQTDWTDIDAVVWVEEIARAVSDPSPSSVLIAHSLGCLAVALVDPRILAKLRGVFLVAPPDPHAANFPTGIRGSWLADRPIPSPSMLVHSANDPYATVEFSAARARTWGSELVCIGHAGHINAASGLGEWHEGLALLQRLC